MYVRTANGTNLKCVANTNNGFMFGSWSSDLTSNSTDNPISFKVSRYGMSLVANFEKAPPLIPPEYLTTIFGAILGIGIPAIGTWFFTTTRRNYLKRYLKTIEVTYDTFHLRNKDECLQRLEQKRKQIADVFEKGKISESYYEKLNDKISEYVSRIK
jgi:hypothetical protein